MVSANVLNGAVYEAEFQAEALRRGFVTHLPCVPVAWDYIVTCPRGILKVQVKGTCQAAHDADGTYKVMTSTGRGPKRRVNSDVDVIACWVDPLRVWYLLPSNTDIPICIRLYAGAKRSSSKHQKYRENWSLFYKQ